MLTFKCTFLINSFFCPVDGLLVNRAKIKKTVSKILHLFTTNHKNLFKFMVLLFFIKLDNVLKSVIWNLINDIYSICLNVLFALPEFLFLTVSTKTMNIFRRAQSNQNISKCKVWLGYKIKRRYHIGKEKDLMNLVVLLSATKLLPDIHIEVSMAM